MTIKQITPALLTLAVAMATSAASVAEDEFAISGNVTMATDYVFRGQSQTLEEAAIQGGFDAEFGGFYVGTWASNVDFGTEAQAEMDFYAGYVFELTEEWSLDIGAIYFYYPGEDDVLDYQEYVATLAWNDLSFGITYSDEYLGDGGEKFFYYAVDYSIGLPSDFSLGLHVGLNKGDDQNIAFEVDPEDTYTDWSISLTKTLAAVDFALTYYDTTIDEDENELGEARLVFSVSKSF